MRSATLLIRNFQAEVVYFIVNVIEDRADQCLARLRGADKRCAAILLRARTRHQTATLKLLNQT